MLVIRRKLVQKGNSFSVTLPKKEILGDEVIVMDLEAFDNLVKRE